MIASNCRVILKHWVEEVDQSLDVQRHRLVLWGSHVGLGLSFGPLGLPDLGLHGLQLQFAFS